MQYPELSTQIQHAWHSSELVQVGLTQAWVYHQALTHEQQYLLQEVSNFVIYDVDGLQTQVLARIEQDLIITDKMNDLIAYGEFYTGMHLTYPLKTNKMHEALEGAKLLVEDIAQFEQIISGQFPDGSNHMPAFPLLLGQIEGGDSSQTFLSTALIEILATITDGNIQTVNQMLNPQWLEQSAVVHITEVNDAIFRIEPDTYDDFLYDYTFAVSSETTPLGLATVHSGYAFGGGRGYQEGQKLFAPEDCSSWIAKLTGIDIEISTADMLNTYRVLSGEGRSYVGDYWYQSPAAIMLDKYNPILADGPQDLKPGDIMVMRRFANEAHDDLGISGHTALVLGVVDDQVLTLNYARNMPDTEGFGLSLYPFQGDENREVFYLEAKQPLTLDDLFADNQLELGGDEPTFWDEIGFVGLVQPVPDTMLALDIPPPLDWVV